MRNPLKQGLKQPCKAISSTVDTGRNAKSTKTRIETRTSFYIGFVSYVAIRNPLKQGLKLEGPRCSTEETFVAMRNPLKQGLKRKDTLRASAHTWRVAMRNPLKQGLKLYNAIYKRIHERWSRNAKSTKTRIETMLSIMNWCNWASVAMRNPLKQGLKRQYSCSLPLSVTLSQCEIH